MHALGGLALDPPHFERGLEFGKVRLDGPAQAVEFGDVLLGSDLPEPLQEELARQLLEDNEGEWDRTLASPKSQKMLESMAKKAAKAKRLGKTYEKGFDEL